MRQVLATTLTLVLLVGGCASPSSSSPQPPAPEPAFVARLIATYEAEPVANPPRSIWRYDYRGSAVYYVPPVCCDVPSALYDTTGTAICSPDGGLTGRGDGRCPDFFERRTGEALVWRDPRS